MPDLPDVQHISQQPLKAGLSERPSASGVGEEAPVQPPAAEDTLAQAEKALASYEALDKSRIDARERLDVLRSKTAESRSTLAAWRADELLRGCTPAEGAALEQEYRESLVEQEIAQATFEELCQRLAEHEAEVTKLVPEFEKVYVAFIERSKEDWLKAAPNLPINEAIQRGLQLARDLGVRIPQVDSLRELYPQVDRSQANRRTSGKR